MAFGGFYSTGSASITAGGKTVTLTGGLTIQLVSGDPFYSGGQCGLIDTITDDTHFELKLPWVGSTLVNAPYVVQFLASSRYEAAFTGQKLRELLTILDGVGLIYYVPASASVPDVSVGEEGQFAIKIVPGLAWTFWVKQSGVWVSLGTPVGVTNRGFWNSATAYAVNDIISRLGVLYIALQPSTNKAPESPSNSAYWQALLSPGNRYDIAFDAADRPDASEQFRKFIAPIAVTFTAGMADSIGHAGTPATSTYVFTINKHHAGVTTQVGTITFSAGQNVPTITSPADFTLARGDYLTLDAQNTRDATLADIAFTLTGFK